MGEEGKDEKIYTQADLDQRLHGQGNEIKRLREVEGNYVKLLAEHESIGKRYEAEKSEVLGQLEQTRAELASFKEQIAGQSSIVESYEKLMANEVASHVAAIEDESLRTRVEDLLKDRAVIDQRAILATFVGARGKPPTQAGGFVKPDPKPPEETSTIRRSAADGLAGTKQRALAYWEKMNAEEG